MAAHKILVIDDSKVIRMRVRDMLPTGNFEILEAKDGEEGINLIHQEHPTLIMLDFLLPKVSGWEVYQHLQNHSQFQKIPLVLMSGREEEVLEKIPKPFEYIEFIAKPFEQKALIAAIKSAMQKASKPRPQAASIAAATAVPKDPTIPPSDGVGASAAEVQALKQQMAKMQAEIDGLKKQLNQIVTFIKQKVK